MMWVNVGRSPFVCNIISLGYSTTYSCVPHKGGSLMGGNNLSHIHVIILKGRRMI